MAYRPLKTLNVSWRVLGLAAGLEMLWFSPGYAYQVVVDGHGLHADYHLGDAQIFSLTARF
jgi:hypothetical protein